MFEQITDAPIKEIKKRKLFLFFALLKINIV
jgi:hypothetical protein